MHLTSKKGTPAAPLSSGCVLSLRPSVFPPEAFPQLFAVMLLAILGTLPAEQLVAFAKES
jgi:hypothetical protein